jgi:hypothetical protein
MANSSEVGLYPIRAAEGDASFHRAAWTVTNSSGAISAASDNTPGFTLTRASAGVYTAVVPKAYAGFPPIIQPVTDTACSWKVTAYDAQAGTATIEFMDAAGAAGELASGDSIHLLCYCSSLPR